LAPGSSNGVVERLKTADGALRRGSPELLAPQMARLTSEVPEEDDWLHEIEYDGYRAMIRIRDGTAQILNRNGEDWTDRFPRLAAAAAALPVYEAILDGEIVRLLPDGRTSFAQLQRDIQAGNTDAAFLYAFDLLYVDGWDLTGATLHDRKKLLEPLIPARGHNPIRFAPHHIGAGMDYALMARTIKVDGIVSKRRFAPYRAGRDGSWLKIKCAGRQDMIVVGVTLGGETGERAADGGAVGGTVAFHLGYYSGTTGALTLAGMASMHAATPAIGLLLDRLTHLPGAPPLARLPLDVRWVAPRIVVETRFAGWTVSGRMRRPTILGCRDDKRADEVIFDRISEIGMNVIPFARPSRDPVEPSRH
jgi:bifunctional non-homologous end joining protein LigD